MRGAYYRGESVLLQAVCYNSQHAIKASML